MISIVSAQHIEPLIDGKIHNGGVTQIEISEDKTYFYTLDIEGLIGVWHLETGKLIRTYNQLQDKLLKNIQLETSKNDLIVIAQKDDKTILFHKIENIANRNANSIIKTVHIEKSFIDFQINPVTKNIVLCSGNESYNGSSRKLSNYQIDIYDEEFNIIYSKDIDQHIVNVHFINRDHIGLIVDEKTGVNLSEIKINFNTNEIITRAYFEDLKYSRFFKSNTTTIGGNKISFHDQVRDFRFDTQKYPREFINNFKFSDDQKHLAIVGGSPSSFEWIPGHLPKEEGSGFVSLINIDNDSIVWQTKGKNNQFNYNVIDIAWIDNHSFIAINYKGEVHYYDIHEDSNYKSVGHPKILPTTFDIDEEFKQVTFSKFDDFTGSFKIEEQSPMSLDTFNFQAILEITNNGIIGGNEFIIKPQSIIDWPCSESSVLNHKPNFENIDILASNDGRFFAYAYAIMFNYNFYNEEKVYTTIKDDEGTAAGFSDGKINYYDEKILLTNTKDDSIKLSLRNDPNIVIYDTQELCEPITLLPNGQIENCQISYSGKYLTYNNISYQQDSYYSLFDLEEKKWFYINEDVSRKINHIDFDKYSDFASIIFSNGEVSIWNIEKNEINSIGVYSTFISENKENKKTIISPSHNEVYMVCNTGICSTSSSSILYSKINESDKNTITNLEFSPNKNYVVTYSKDTFGKEYISTYTYPELNLTYKQLNQNQTRYDGYFASEHKGRGQSHFFHKTKNLLLLNDSKGKINLINLEEKKIVATLMLLPEGEWLTYTPQGYFEGSKKGRESLYYTIDGQVILFNQIKEKFWISNLLNKVINSPELISYRSDALINEFPPSVNLELYSEASLIIKNKDTDVKLGKVSFFINDKEIVENINLENEAQCVINLKDYENYLYAGGLNKISVITYTPNGWLNSRHQAIYLDTNLAQSKGDGDTPDPFTRSSRKRRNNSSTDKPGLYGVFVGTSIYDNESLNLQFADFDAKSLRDGFLQISENMYNPDRIDLKLLTTGSEGSTTIVPTKANILNALEDINANAKVDDIVVLFLSGHGKSIDQDFFYLTSEFNEDDVQNPEELKKVTISSQELKDALRENVANKQLLILDACHSGQINKIVGEGGKATTTSQQKSLENLEDKTGVFILASSEGNQKSYEATTLQKGILTFSLLLGMSEVESENEIINVVDLLNYASKEAEDISKTQASKPQRPVLGISNGSNSFPIGIKNGNFMVDLPDSKIKLSRPNFGQKSNNNDPQNMEKIIEHQLKERGSFGTTGPFNYIEKTNTDAYKLVGFYEMIGNNIKATWHIIKYGIGAVESMSLTKLKSEKVELANEIINTSVTKILELEK